MTGKAAETVGQRIRRLLSCFAMSVPAFLWGIMLSKNTENSSMIIC